MTDTDLVSILDSFTNYVLNERVRAYNEGFDAGEMAAIAEEYKLNPIGDFLGEKAAVEVNQKDLAAYIQTIGRSIEERTTERCAQVAERYGCHYSAARIRAGDQPLPALPLQADSGSLL